MSSRKSANPAPARPTCRTPMTGPYYDPKKPMPSFEATTAWLRGEGDCFDVVLSSRVRLARNLAGAPSAAKASRRDRIATLDTCRNQVLRAALAERMIWIDLHDAPVLDRSLLVERHL